MSPAMFSLNITMYWRKTTMYATYIVMFGGKIAMFPLNQAPEVTYITMSADYIAM